MKSVSVILLSVIFCLFLVSVPRTRPYTKMVDRVSSSIIRITLEQDGAAHSCTGEVIGINLVLTAAHCKGDNLLADGAKAKILKTDDYFDLMLLSVPTAKPDLTLRDTPVVRFEDLTAIGYSFGFTQLTVLKVTPFLVGYAASSTMAAGTFTQGDFIHGMSGGPVVDADGRMVGMTQQTTQGTGYGVGVLLIRGFLLGAVE